MGSASVHEDASDVALASRAGRTHPSLGRGIACTLAGGVLWGLCGTCSKYLMSFYGIDPLWLVCVREVGASLIFLLVAFACDRERAVGILADRRTMLGLVAVAFGAILMSNVAYLETVSWTNSATATVLQSLSLVIILVYVCVTVRRRPRRREVVGMALALLGTFLIATGGNPAQLNIPAEGFAWGMACAVAAAFLAILPARLLGRWGSFVVNGYSMLVSGVVLSAVVRPWETVPTLDLVGGALLAFVVVFGTFGAFALYLQGVKDVGSMRASLLATVEPVTATVASVLWLGVVFSPTDLVGFAAIIAMVYLTA
jgi:drug/metabolite transporter (DMT)-like permease